MLSDEVANANIIDFVLTQPGRQPTICRTQDESNRKSFYNPFSPLKCAMVNFTQMFVHFRSCNYHFGFYQ
jgi:hypothetical protein